MQQAQFTEADVVALGQLFGRLGQWGSCEVDYQNGRPVVAHLHLTFKPPLPRWIRLLAADVTRQAEPVDRR